MHRNFEHTETLNTYPYCTHNSHAKHIELAKQSHDKHTNTCMLDEQT